MSLALCLHVVSIYTSLLQAIDGVMSLALCPQVVSTPLSPPGDRWCDVLGFVPAGSVYASLLQASDGGMWGFVRADHKYNSEKRWVFNLRRYKAVGVFEHSL